MTSPHGTYVHTCTNTHVWSLYFVYGDFCFPAIPTPDFLRVLLDRNGEYLITLYNRWVCNVFFYMFPFWWNEAQRDEDYHTMAVPIFVRPWGLDYDLYLSPVTTHTRTEWHWMSHTILVMWPKPVFYFKTLIIIMCLLFYFILLHKVLGYL